MIDGYSVKDAAIVLGIPERRVWELIARGVLSSAPEGPDGMRVFLQPRAVMPEAVPEPRLYRADEPASPPNTNGGTAHEISPFRELLTEFRSLTERYGQALLALGEARGEVAALRTRVELLEARMDLRLPGTRPASTVAWEIPGQAARSEAADEPAPEQVESAAELEDDPAAGQAVAEEAETAGDEAHPAEAESGAEEATPAAEPLPAPSRAKQRRAETRRRKIRGGRTVLAGIAEALARADDPTAAELPGAEEAAESLAALQREVVAAREAAIAGEATTTTDDLPDDAVSTDQLDMADEPDFIDAASPAAVIEVMDEVVVDDEPPVAEQADEKEVPTGEPTPEIGQAAAPIGLVSPGSPYSTEVVEPDWFADGDFTWLEAAQAEADARVQADAMTSDADEATAAVAEAVADAEVEPEPEPEPEPVTEAEAEPVADEPADRDDGAGVADTDRPRDGRRALAEESFDAAGPSGPGAPESRDEAFEPSAEDQAQADEEARAAIQDAFDEPLANPSVERSVAFMSPPEPEPGFEPQPDPEPEPEPEPEPDSGPEPEAKQQQEAIQDAFSEPMPAPAWAPPDPQQTGTARVEPGPDREGTLQQFIAQPVASAISAGGSAAPATADSPAGEEALMWLGDEFEESNLEIATHGWHSPGASASAKEAPPLLELSDEELSQLAQDEGWDRTEVEAIRSLLGRPSDTPHANPEPAEAPHADEDDTGHDTRSAADAAQDPITEEASATTAGRSDIEPDMAAPKEAADHPGEGANEKVDSADDVEDDTWQPLSRLLQRTATPPIDDADWLKGRRGPAATAYRRLRRLFPG